MFWFIDAPSVTNAVVKAATEDAERARRSLEIIRAERMRESNRKHKAEINNSVKHALMKCGATEKLARKIVKSIANGNIPNVTILNDTSPVTSNGETLMHRLMRNRC